MLFVLVDDAKMRQELSEKQDKSSFFDLEADFMLKIIR